MIDSASYVIGLIKKQVEGTLTKAEHADLKLAKLLYSDEQWFSMEVDAFCELEDERPDKEPIDWQSAFRQMQVKVKQRRRGARWKAVKRKLAIAALVLAVIGWAVKHHWDIHYGPLERIGACGNVVDTLIPASEFRGLVSSAHAARIAIAPGVEGHIARVGNLSIDRDPVGMVQITALAGAAVPPVEGGYGDIRIATGEGEQCGVRLPDGTLVRLNSSSAMYYPISRDTAGAGPARITGGALVQIPQQGDGQQAILETANVRLYSAKGNFVVHASSNATTATLLEGELSAVSRNEGRQGYAKARADVISVSTSLAPTGRPRDFVLSMRDGNVDGIMQWARATMDYRNVRLKEFIRAEESRFGLVFGDLRCLPDSKRINAAMCYRATVDDFIAAVKKEGVRVYFKEGQYTFCDPATGKPWARSKMVAHAADDGSCAPCMAMH